MPSYKDLDIKFREALRDLRHLALEAGAENYKVEEASARVEQTHRDWVAWDDEELDGTDGAHPAYWRGGDHACIQLSRQLLEALGENIKASDDPNEFLPRLRKRVQTIQQTLLILEDEVGRAMAHQAHPVTGMRVDFHGVFAEARHSTLVTLEKYIKRMKGK